MKPSSVMSHTVFRSGNMGAFPFIPVFCVLVQPYYAVCRRWDISADGSMGTEAPSLDICRCLWAGGRCGTKWKTLFQVALGVKDPRAAAADARYAGSIPGSGRSPGV